MCVVYCVNGVFMSGICVSGVSVVCLCEGMECVWCMGVCGVCVCVCVCVCVSVCKEYTCHFLFFLPGSQILSKLMPCAGCRV